MNWIITHGAGWLWDSGKQPDGWTKGNCKLEDIPQERRQAFRLLDGDNEVYFTGWLDRDAFQVADGDTAFLPLDDFGAGYGCVGMEYKESGKWVTL